MGRQQILIAALDTEKHAAEQLRERLSLAWNDPGRVQCAPMAPPPSADQLHKLGAVIALLGPEASMGEPLALLETAEQASVPVLVLGCESPEVAADTFVGALSMPASSPAEVLRAALEGLMHAGAEARRLRADLSLAHRAQGGVEGEISKMHEELQLAAMVQRELLPRELPQVHGVSFGTLWRPANYVSGDIFDVQRLDEDHVGVFLADAVGHGVPAALMTMVISRSLLMKEIVDDAYRILRPTEVLGRLNAEMYMRQGPTPRFATAVYALIDCRRRVMQMAGAGHPAPLLLRGDEPMKPIETTGGLLGIFEDEPFEQIEIELHVEDRVLFYSDGFEQAFPPKESDAYQRLVPTTQYRAEFDSLPRKGSPQQLIEELRSRLDVQTGSLHQTDDLTMICAHAGPIGAAEPSKRRKLESPKRRTKVA